MNKSMLLVLSLLMHSSLSLAQTNGNKGITFQGVIKDTSNPASPTFPSVTSNVMVQILGLRSDGNSCILWEELHSGVQIEKGYLYLVVGRGNKTATSALSFKDVFNDKSKTGLTCSNGFTDYVPQATDSRKLRVVVSSLGITADFNMRSAPLAVHAESAGSAETVNGKSSADFINVNAPLGLTQTAAEAWFGSSVMANLLAGTYSSSTAVTAGNVTGVVAVANGGTGSNTVAAARTNLGLGPLATMTPSGTADATTYLRGDGTWTGLPSAPTLAGDVSGAVGSNTVDKIKGTAVNTSMMVNGHFLRFDSGAWINGALVAADVPALDWSKITTGKPTTLAGYGVTDAVSKNGDTMAGALNMGFNDLTATGYILMSPQRALGLGTYTNAQETTLTGGLSTSHKGYTWYNSEANQVKFWNGTTVQALGIAGSGITSLGGQTGGAQALANGTAGTAPAWVSGSNTHTLNIPMAATGSVTAGLLSNTDYAAFAAKLGTATTFGGEVSGTYNAITLNTVPISKGGTGQTTAVAAFGALSPLTTKGDMLVHNGTANQRMAVGFNGKALIADSAEVSGVKWGDIFATDLLSMVTTGIVQRNSAGSYSAVTVNAPLTYASGILGVNVGTAAGSVAAGDDSRVTGALQRSGGTMTGALGMAIHTNAQEATLVGTLNATHKGYVWFNSDANQVKVWNGTAAQALDIAGSGINSFAGQSGSSQSLAVGTTGNFPAWSSASNTHTLNIPMASTASVTAGLISKTDYDNFNGKLSAAITSPLTGHHLRYNGSAWVNSLVNLSSDISGTLSISNGGTGATTVGTARINLGLGTVATRDTGAASGNIPVIGVSGITGNKMCTSDGANSIICNTNIPASQWVTSGSDIYFNAGKVAIGAAVADRNLSVTNNSAGQGTMNVQNSSSSGFSSVEFFNSGGVAEGFVGWANSGASGVSNAVVLGSGGVRPITLFTNNTRVLNAFPSGNVGIGVNSDPDAKLRVNGVIASALVNDSSPTSIDMALGNYQHTSTGCSGASWDLANMVEGTTYTIAVQNNTHTGACSFTNSGSTFRYQPSNATPAPGHVIYTLMKVGTVIYVSWVEGFN